MKINKDNPYAVVLHIENTGYGVVRSIAHHGIPIVAFQKDIRRPEAKSRLCEKIINFDFNNYDDLLLKLIEFSKHCKHKPVLYITSDLYIEFIIDNRDIINHHFAMHYPSNEVVRLLLNKDKFYSYGLNNSLPVPRTYIIQSMDDITSIIQHAEFPLILKPNYYNKNWGDSELDKAYIINKKDQLLSFYKTIKEIQSNIIVQEYIPGPDSNFEYCLVYFNDKSECLSSFTGQKIRQWPVNIGSLSITKPIKNDKLTKYTIEFFKQLNYKGFGSLEFKKHSKNGQYFIMEPTVGRPDQQLLVATANNENMPIIAYESITGRKIIYKPITSTSKDVIYIENWKDKFSVLQLMYEKKLTIRQYFSSIKGEKIYSFFDKRDLAVYLFSYILYFRKVLNKIERKIKKIIYANLT